MLSGWEAGCQTTDMDWFQFWKKDILKKIQPLKVLYIFYRNQHVHMHIIIQEGSGEAYPKLAMVFPCRAGRTGKGGPCVLPHMSWFPFLQHCYQRSTCVIKITKNRPPMSSFLPLTCLLILASISIPFPHVQQAPNRQVCLGQSSLGFSRDWFHCRTPTQPPSSEAAPCPATLSPTHPFSPHFLTFRMFSLYVNICLISVPAGSPACGTE